MTRFYKLTMAVASTGNVQLMTVAEVGQQFAVLRSVPRMIALETEAYVRQHADWQGTLYRTAAAKKTKQTIRLIPYYAWGNRGKSDMTVWMPAVY